MESIKVLDSLGLPILVNKLKNETSLAIGKSLQSLSNTFSANTSWNSIGQGMYEIELDAWSDTITTTPNNYKADIPSKGTLIVIKTQNSSNTKASKIVQIYIPVGNNALVVKRTRNISGSWSSWLPISDGHTHNEYTEKTYSVPYYKCLTNIANGLDVYDGIKSNTTNTVIIKCNSNYRVGNSFCIIFENIDLFQSGDIVLSLTYNSATIASGAIYDTEGNSIESGDLSANALYKVTISATDEFKIEQLDADTIYSIDTDRQLSIDNVFFVEFKNSVNVSSGIKLQANYNGTTAGAYFIYDADGNKATSVETNKLYPFERTSNGFKMMKMG